MTDAPNPLSLAEFWMPFTANRQFKANPRLMSTAEGMYYTSVDGRRILDGTAGLWCVHAGHARDEIADAVGRQVRELDFAPTFQMGHPLPFELATRLTALTPPTLNRVFFTNSGSESVETALKMALAYHQARGESQRIRIIGRERGYHGVNFGGMTVGGIVNNRKRFGPLLPGVDHLRHTLDIPRNAFSRGVPPHGVELADDLERLCQLHDASTIAAVIIEPVAGSTGVILPPAGYLQRIREICDRHGILLIFDEVITGFGRCGAPFAAQAFGVTPDIMATAKALTNGVVPMGAVFASTAVHDAIVQGPENVIEFFHGYTYSGHPLACAAAMASLDIYARENLLTRGAELAAIFEDAAHNLRALPNVVDIRNIGLVAGIELKPRAGAPGARAYDVFNDCFHNRGLLIRVTGDIIAMSPPLIIESGEIEQIFETLAAAITAAA
ncbi:MAG: aspartate aminotransferase family protein [Gammaproteobacteria bacterium]|nr:aspartate aminotransferase family protein [Gammaproteobacteria bacterium]